MTEASSATNTAARVAIIGAGIAGLACARALAPGSVRLSAMPTAGRSVPRQAPRSGLIHRSSWPCRCPRPSRWYNPGTIPSARFASALISAPAARAGRARRPPLALRSAGRAAYSNARRRLCLGPRGPCAVRRQPARRARGRRLAFGPPAGPTPWPDACGLCLNTTSCTNVTCIIRATLFRPIFKNGFKNGFHDRFHH